jgi:hypothetical protein
MELSMKWVEDLKCDVVDGDGIIAVCEIESTPGSQNRLGTFPR